MEGGDIVGLMVGLAIFFIIFSIGIVILIGMWKTFVKAGQPGWASLIPIYNIIVMVKIAGQPLWIILGLFVPALNIATLGWIYFNMSRKFGRGIGTAILLFFGIGWPIIGFGSSTHCDHITNVSSSGISNSLLLRLGMINALLIAFVSVILAKEFLTTMATDDGSSISNSESSETSSASDKHIISSSSAYSLLRGCCVGAGGAWAQDQKCVGNWDQGEAFYSCAKSKDKDTYIRHKSGRLEKLNPRDFMR